MDEEHLTCRHVDRAIVAALAAVAVQSAAPGAMWQLARSAESGDAGDSSSALGFGISRITLPPKAAQRLDIQTG